MTTSPGWKYNAQKFSFPQSTRLVQPRSIAYKEIGHHKSQGSCHLHSTSGGHTYKVERLTKFSMLSGMAPLQISTVKLSQGAIIYSLEDSSDRMQGSQSMIMFPSKLATRLENDILMMLLQIESPEKCCELKFSAFRDDSLQQDSDIVPGNSTSHKGLT